MSNTENTVSVENTMNHSTQNTSDTMCRDTMFTIVNNSEENNEEYRLEKQISNQPKLPVSPDMLASLKNKFNRNF